MSESNTSDTDYVRIEEGEHLTMEDKTRLVDVPSFHLAQYNYFVNCAMQTSLTSIYPDFQAWKIPVLIPPLFLCYSPLKQEEFLDGTAANAWYTVAQILQWLFNLFFPIAILINVPSITIPNSDCLFTGGLAYFSLALVFLMAIQEGVALIVVLRNMFVRPGLMAFTILSHSSDLPNSSNVFLSITREKLLSMRDVESGEIVRLCFVMYVTAHQAAQVSASTELDIMFYEASWISRNRNLPVIAMVTLFIIYVLLIWGFIWESSHLPCDVLHPTPTPTPEYSPF